MGVSASFASYVRHAERFPSPKVQRAMVKNLGTTFEALNDALVAAKAGRVMVWVDYMRRLAEVRCEPVKGAEPPAQPGTWVQRKDRTWLNLAA
jgi:hypothetical protein